MVYIVRGCAHGFLFLFFWPFQKELFDWPITNILDHEALPQHKSLNMLPSPKWKHVLPCFPHKLPLQVIYMEVEPLLNNMG